MTTVGRVKPRGLVIVSWIQLEDCKLSRRTTEERCRLGVPACFLPSQRRATEAAARKAGLQKVQIANEPELAARAHGTSQHDERLAMVFDGRGHARRARLVDVGGRTAESFPLLVI